MLATALFLGGGGLVPAQAPSANKMMRPRFDGSRDLLRPEGYREWVFAGASLGMGYNEGKPGGEQRFHNIYIQPEAYRHFRESGEFPDGTMLVMEVLTAADRTSINRQGKFEDRPLGIEVSVKDAKHVPEKWGYYSFIGSGGAPLAKARPFPKEACWNCHHEHGAADNVFVQFYPVLRAAREQK